MRLRALIALPALLGLGACVDPYYDGYNGGYGPSYGPTGYVSGTYYGGGSPGYYYDRDRRDYRGHDGRPDNRPDRQTEYRPRPPERPPVYSRPPPPESNQPRPSPERDRYEMQRRDRGPLAGE